MEFGGLDIVLAGAEIPHPQVVEFLRDIVDVWPDFAGEIEEPNASDEMGSFDAVRMLRAEDIPDNSQIVVARCKESLASLSDGQQREDCEGHILLFIRRQGEKWEVTLVLSEDPEHPPQQMLLKHFLRRFQNYEIAWPPSMREGS